MKIPVLLSWLTILVNLIPLTGFPGSDETRDREITYLLNAVATSDCTFFRNDVPYSSSEAAVHIGKKYDYLRDKIGSAEEFIELCASQSSMSGKPYMIKCGDSDAVPSRAWLKNRLDDFRRKRMDQETGQSLRDVPPPASFIEARATKKCIQAVVRLKAGCYTKVWYHDAAHRDIDHRTYCGFTRPCRGFIHPAGGWLALSYW
jgi:hypothetical protein